MLRTPFAMRTLILFPVSVIGGRRMVGSEEASIAAEAGRGIPFFSVSKDYKIVLRPLPTGQEISWAVVLHCDNTCRSCQIDCFRQPLNDYGVIQEVGGIGAHQMPHV